MANPEHLAILKLGVEQWNKWRREHPEIMPDLSNVSIPWEILDEAALTEFALNAELGPVNTK